MKERIRSFLDKYLNKFISRKLFVFIVGTILLCVGLIGPEVWVTLASFYITVEGVKDWTVANNTSKSTTTVTTDTDSSKSSISVTQGPAPTTTVVPMPTVATTGIEPVEVKITNANPVPVSISPEIKEEESYGRQG